MVDASRINLFLNTPGYGSGPGYGTAFGDGSGSGSGFGDGDGSGSGFGDGDGSGSGFGFGDGDGSGSGLGEGYVDCLKEYNGKKVYVIDSIPCVFISIKKNFALIDIINPDLSTTKTFLAKDENFFAHGESIKEAVEAAYKKKIINMDIESKINLFVKTFGFNSVQSNKTFFEWHHTLTGSCEIGRNRFAEEKDIDLNESMTTKEFLELTKNEYGGETIKKIIQTYTQTKE